MSKPHTVQARPHHVVVLLALAVATATAACAARPPPASAPAADAEGRTYAQEPGGYPAAGAQPAQPATVPQASPPPPPPQAPGAAAPAQTAQPGAAGDGDRHAIAVSRAVSDIESSQRELDVAGSDCRNACRALGSMDRAAGHLCELATGDAEGQRCEDAKGHVYSARARVKRTCGTCPNGPSVERAAPIPSQR